MEIRSDWLTKYTDTKLPCCLQKAKNFRWNFRSSCLYTIPYENTNIIMENKLRALFYIFSKC